MKGKETVKQLSKEIVEWLNGGSVPELLIVSQEMIEIELTPAALRHTLLRSCSIIIVRARGSCEEVSLC